MKADGGFVKDEDAVTLSPAHFACQLQALGFAAGEAGRFLAQGQVAKAQLLQYRQALMDDRKVPADLKRLVYAERHQLRQGVRLLLLFAKALYEPRLLCVAGAVAVRAGDVHVRQKLHVQADAARAVAHRAAQRAGIVGKVARLIAPAFGVRGPGVDLSKLVVDVRVGRNGRADV